MRNGLYWIFTRFSLPKAGSQSFCWAKTHCSISANQKTGIDTPTKAKSIAKKSNHEFRFHALIMPAFTPTITANKTAKNVSSKVAAKRGPISLEISAFVFDEDAQIALEDIRNVYAVLREVRFV